MEPMTTTRSNDMATAVIEPSTRPDALSALIDKALASDEVILSEVAASIVETMERDHPEELMAWLRSQAERLVRDEIGALMTSARSQAVSSSRAREFGDAIAADDVERVGLFATWHVVAESNLRKRLADMTGAEHLFVAEAYEVSANTALMRAAFHRALSKKVGKKRTADVISEAECERLLKSITQPAAGRAA